MIVQFSSPELDEACGLVKAATALKKANIQQAIALIEKAVDIANYPAHHEKLACYHFDAGDHEKAFKIVNKFIETWSSQASFENLRHGSLAKWFSRKVDFLIKLKRDSEAIDCFMLQCWNSIVELAVQGRQSELENTIKQGFDFFSNHRINKSIAAAGWGISAFGEATKISISPNSHSLLAMSRIYNETDFWSPENRDNLPDDGIDYIDQILLRHPEFMCLYFSLDGGFFQMVKP